MKSTSIIIATGLHTPELDRKVNKETERLKKVAVINATHFAGRNQPDLKGDDLNNYTSDIKHSIEKVNADVQHELNHGSHFIHAKIDAEFYRDKDQRLEREIKEKKTENENTEHILKNSQTVGNIGFRIKLILISALVIYLGEVIFNSMGFQVIGEIFLFALLLSMAVSFAIFIFSHLAQLLFKRAKSKAQEIGIVVASLILITGIFWALALLRSQYLEKHDIHVNPVFFILLNLFFFIVSALLSYFFMPTWEEYKLYSEHEKQLKVIKMREAEIKEMEQEQINIRDVMVKITKERILVNQHINHYANKLIKSYWECIGIFKTTNKALRKDMKTPDCFTKPMPDPDMNIKSLPPDNSKLNQ